jgi:hypothetical protein
MPTPRTVRVKDSPSGPDEYLTLANAEAGEQNDLVSLDLALDIECYAKTSADGPVVVDGWTTDATRRIRIYTHPSGRHAGVWDDSKYRIVRSASGSGYALSVLEQYTVVDGLQVACTAADSYSPLILGSGSDNSSALNCIVKGAANQHVTLGYGIHLYANNQVARNCIVYGCRVAGCRFASIGTGAFEACTSIANNLGIARAAGTLTVTNCYAGNNAGGDYSGTMTKTACASSDATGSTGLQNIACSAASGAKFTSITGGSENFHLQSGSALIAACARLASTLTDIDGEDRADPACIGADEYVAAGGGPVLPVFLHHYRQQGIL